MRERREDEYSSSNFSLSKNCIRILSISIEIEPNRGKSTQEVGPKKSRSISGGISLRRGSRRKRKIVEKFFHAGNKALMPRFCPSAGSYPDMTHKQISYPTGGNCIIRCAKWYLWYYFIWKSMNHFYILPLYISSLLGTERENFIFTLANFIPRDCGRRKKKGVQIEGSNWINLLDCRFVIGIY